jgi:hypothetical protein
MSQKWLFSIFVGVFLLSLAGPVWAGEDKSFIVFPIKASSNYDHDARTMSKLLRNELDNLKDTDVRGTQGTDCHEVSCAKKIRNNRNVDCVVIGELTTLGGSLTLLMQAVWGDETYNYNITLAGTSEFQKVVKRLAEAIRDRSSWEGKRGVGSVAKSEQYPYTGKVHGMVRFGANIGMIAPLDDTYLGGDYLTAINAVFRYEISQVGIEVDAGLVYSNTLDEVVLERRDEQGNVGETIKVRYVMTQYPLNIGAHYYFIDGDISPFIGGGGGISYMVLTKDSDRSEGPEESSYWMFTVRGYAGVEFLRTHTFQMNLRAGYTYGFINFGNENLELKNDNKKGAHGVLIQLGFTFGG